MTLVWKPKTKKTPDDWSAPGLPTISWAGVSKIEGWSGSYRVCTIERTYHGDRCVNMSVHGPHVKMTAWFGGKNPDHSLKCLSEKGVTEQDAMNYAQDQWNAWCLKAGLTSV
jgi:adenosylmethionine-8-amino-7-oxononanoate aminotransferase